MRRLVAAAALILTLTGCDLPGGGDVPCGCVPDPTETPSSTGSA